MKPKELSRVAIATLFLLAAWYFGLSINTHFCPQKTMSAPTSIECTWFTVTRWSVLLLAGVICGWRAANVVTAVACAAAATALGYGIIYLVDFTGYGLPLEHLMIFFVLGLVLVMVEAIAAAITARLTRVRAVTSAG